MTDFSSGKSTLTSKEYKEYKICKHHFKHHIKTYIFSTNTSLYQALSQCRRVKRQASSKNSEEIKTARRKKEKACKHLIAKYFSLPTTPPTFLCQNVKCTNVQSKKVSHSSHVCLTRKSVHVTYENRPIIWYTSMRY